MFVYDASRSNFPINLRTRGQQGREGGSVKGRNRMRIMQIRANDVVDGVPSSTKGRGRRDFYFDTFPLIRDTAGFRVLHGGP